MTPMEFEKASELEQERYYIKEMLLDWEHRIVSRRNLAYEKNGIFVEFDNTSTAPSQEVFKLFRDMSMHNLRTRLIEIQKEFDEL